VVVPDSGGQGEQALGDADVDALDGASALLIEVRLVVEGVVDRLDELADRLGRWLTGMRVRLWQDGRINRTPRSVRPWR
jgi:chloramphenicol 3-O-phosphotransferase